MAIRPRVSPDACRTVGCPTAGFFSDLTTIQTATLCQERVAYRYETRQVVAHQDTPALGVFCVHSGQVKLTRLTGAGEKIVVGVRKSGDLLGVREVLCLVPYEVSVEAIEPSVLCTIPRRAFLDAVRGCPALALRLLERVAGEDLRTEARLVAWSHAGTTRETLSRTLAGFVRLGAVRLENGTTRILDRSLLERFVT